MATEERGFPYSEPADYARPEPDDEDRPRPNIDLQAHEFCGRAKASASYIRLELARVESVLRLLTHELDELMSHYPKNTDQEN